MNKPIYFILTIFIFFITTSAFQERNECVTMDLKKELKNELKPNFKYDSAKTTHITYKSKKQTKEIEVPLYMGEKYRFLFNTAGLPKNIEISIYNKKATNSKRKLLYSLKTEEDKHIYVFEPGRSRKMYINYTIPETSELGLSGCMVFLVGYRIDIF